MKSQIPLLSLLFTFWSLNILHGQDLFLDQMILQKKQLTNLPTFYISTNDIPIESKEVYVQGILSVSAQNELNGKYNDTIEIRGRGNSTWGMAKKPYRLKLKKKYKLLDMPAVAKSWPMLANYADKSLMRNALAFEIGRQCGLYYTPSCRFVDVVLNNEYLGNYLVTDQVEVGPDRVEVVEQKATDTQPYQIEGGYLLEVDGFAVTDRVAEGANFPEGFSSNYNTLVTIKYPKDDKINSEQRNYIIDYFNRFETVVRNYEYGKPIGEIADFINVDDFVNWYIATELTSNTDCVWSIYMKKDRGDSRFSFGPLWDNDISFANDNRLGDLRNKLIIDYAHQSGTVRQFIRNLLYIPEIQQRIKTRWEEIGAQNIKDRLLAFIDSTTLLLGQSQSLNYQRWPILDKVIYLELEARGSFDAEVDFLKQYVEDRIDWLDKALPHLDEIFYVEAIDEKTWYMLCNNLNGKALDTEAGKASVDDEVVLWECADGERESQLFRFDCVEGDVYRIRNLSDDLVLDAKQYKGTSGKNYGDYQLSLCELQSESSTQLWRMNQFSTRLFHLENIGAGFSVDNYGGRSDNGNEVNMFNSDVNNINQQWYLVPVASVIDGEVNDRWISVRLYTSDGILYVESDREVEVAIYTLQGIKHNVYEKRGTFLQIPLSKGYYAVSIDNKTKIVYVK